MVALKPLLVSAAIMSCAYAQYNPLQNITVNFGPNPTNITMYIYTPPQVVAPTPLLVALHDCGSNGISYSRQTLFAPLADQHGYIVVFPSAPPPGACWDVHSSATQAHDGGGDSLGIASVVRYAVVQLGVDPARVFVTGASSGAMMGAVLLGAYPDLFAAGSLYTGVPFGCATAWNDQCATGQVVKTPQQWGDLVRDADPGFAGARPRVQFWHGAIDALVSPQNFWEEIKQWTNIFGVSQTPTSNTSMDAQGTFSRASFGPNVQGILAQGYSAGVPMHETETLDWFGLSALTLPAPTTTTSAAPTSSPSAVGVPHWHQCGGIGFTGATVCAPPFTCLVMNPYFSECL